MSDGGKGSAPRPFSVSPEQFANSWEQTFGKKDKRVIEDAQAEDEAFEELARKYPPKDSEQDG